MQKQQFNPVEIEIESLAKEGSEKSKTIARLNAQVYELANKNNELEVENKKLKKNDKSAPKGNKSPKGNK